MRVVAKNKKSFSRKIKRKNKKPQRKQKPTILKLKLKRMWKKASKKLHARKNRSKIVVAAVVVLFLGIWWYAKTDSSFAPTTRSNSVNTYYKNTYQSTYDTPEKKSVPKKHDSIFYNNSAPKAKNSRTKNYSSAYEN